MELHDLALASLSRHPNTHKTIYSYSATALHNAPLNYVFFATYKYQLPRIGKVLCREQGASILHSLVLAVVLCAAHLPALAVAVCGDSGNSDGAEGSLCGDLLAVRVLLLVLEQLLLLRRRGQVVRRNATSTGTSTSITRLLVHARAAKASGAHAAAGARPCERRPHSLGKNVLLRLRQVAHVHQHPVYHAINFGTVNDRCNP